jgi:hypothetical protein
MGVWNEWGLEWRKSVVEINVEKRTRDRGEGPDPRGSAHGTQLLTNPLEQFRLPAPQMKILSGV